MTPVRRPGYGGAHSSALRELAAKLLLRLAATALIDELLQTGSVLAICIPNAGKRLL
jgi:hypothetical protein